MVLIEHYSSVTGGSAASTLTGSHTVGNPDEVLVILAHEANGVSSDGITLTFNGVAVPLITNGSNGVPGDHVKLYYLKNPLVGTYTIVMATPDGPSSWGWFAYSLSGVNKTYTPITQVANFAAVNPFTAILNVPMAGGLVIEGITSEDEAPLRPLNPVQVQSGAADDGALSSGIANAVIYPAGRTAQPISWQNNQVANMTGTYLAVFIEADFMASISNPVISLEERYSIIRGNALDSGVGRANVKVDYPTRTPYLSSFLHTVGRISAPSGGGSSQSVTQIKAVLTATGGTQVIAAVQIASVTQVAATLTATGGIQVIASASSNVQVAANITATGGTQVVASVRIAAVTQLAATLTATGGTQVVAAVNIVAVAQAAANLTATGGTQVIATVNIVAIAQIKAVLTATGGTQVVNAVTFSAITQVAATLTVTGGVQVAAILQAPSITQVAANLTMTTGTQAVVSLGPPPPPVSFSLNAQISNITIKGSSTDVTLAEPLDILYVTLTGASLSATISSSPPNVVLRAKSQSVTLDGRV